MSHRRPPDYGLLAAVVSCLLLSGSGSLILEVVWSRLLKLVFGSTTLAISTILVAYMLGLGLGGLFGGRLATRTRNGVRAYGLFELLIGAYALTVPSILGLFPELNRTVLAPLDFWSAAIVRFAVVLVFLLLPTLLMGATLPVLVAALVHSRSDLARRVGLLYGINTLGAVVGVVLSTFILFRAVGVRWTNVTGAAFDIAVGVIALAVIAPRLDRVAPAAAAPEAPSQPRFRERWNLPLVGYALVGFTALVYEVAWTRSLSMITGSSIYAFASMLAAFLTGIGLGSLVGRTRFDRLRLPLRAYGLGVAALGVLSLATMQLFRVLPDALLWILQHVGLNGVNLVASGVLLSIAVMLPPTLVLGALFPLVARAASTESRPASATVGDVYFVNTLGSAAGAFAAGFLLIPRIGLGKTIFVAIAINLLLAALLVARESGWRAAPRFGLAVGFVLGALALLFAPPTWSRAQLTRGVYYAAGTQMEFGLELRPIEGVVEDEILFYRDGLNTTVSIHRTPGGIDMRLNGKTDASLADMTTQAFSGHIPMLFGPPARNVLVVGYASGVTTGVTTLYEPDMVEVVELEPAVIEGSRFFDPWNYAPLENPRVEVVIDDGRAHLASTPHQYDVVISEPSNPWISGASNLFTREYFQLVDGVLTPDGRLLQWIQLYDMDFDGVAAVLKELERVFPYVYGFLTGPDDADLVLLSTRRPLDFASFPRWEDVPERARRDLARVGVYAEEDLWSLLRLDHGAIETLASEGRYDNTDDNMFVELHAPLTMYRGEFSVPRVVARFPRGVADTIDRPDAPLDTDTLGRIAYSYSSVRRDPLVAATLLSEVVGREPTPHVMAASLDLGLRSGEFAPDVILPRVEKMVGAAPFAFATQFTRAEVMMRLKRFEDALDSLGVAIAAHPIDPRPRRYQVRALGALGRGREAIEAASVLLDDPTEAQFHRSLWADVAVAAAQIGDFDQAIEFMKRYLEAFPLDEGRWRLLARMYQARARAGGDPPDEGDLAEARRAERNAETARYDGLILAHRKARLFELVGRPERAIATLRGLVASHPDYHPAADDLRRLEQEYPDLARASTGARFGVAPDAR